MDVSLCAVGGSLIPEMRKRGGLALGVMMTLALAVLMKASVLFLLVMTLGSGGGSPRGGRGPGSLLEGWGGFGNRCEDVRLRGSDRDGPGVGLSDPSVVHSVKGTYWCGFNLSFVTWNCASLFGSAPRDEIGGDIAPRLTGLLVWRWATMLLFFRRFMGVRATFLHLDATFLIIFSVVRFARALVGLLVVFSLLSILG